jgi:hypothetical protein
LQLFTTTVLTLWSIAAAETRAKVFVSMTRTSTTATTSAATLAEASCAADLTFNIAAAAAMEFTVYSSASATTADSLTNC